MSTEKELKKIEADEAKIMALQGEILREDKAILGFVRGLQNFRDFFISRLSRKKIVLGLVVTVGIVAIWRGTWYILDEVSWLHSPYASIAFGVILLLALKKVNDLV